MTDHPLNRCKATHHFGTMPAFSPPAQCELEDDGHDLHDSAEWGSWRVTPSSPDPERSDTHMISYPRFPLPANTPSGPSTWEMVIRDAESILAVNDDAPELKLMIVDLRDCERIERRFFGPEVGGTPGVDRWKLVGAYRAQINLVACLRSLLDDAFDSPMRMYHRKGNGLEVMYTRAFEAAVELRGMIAREFP